MESVAGMMEEGVRKGVFPGAVLLVSVGGEIKYHKSFGMSDIFSKKPMQNDFIFDLASLTKPLSTAMAIYKLIEQKKLFLKTRVSTIIKEFSYKGKADITIGQLLNHTSGLASYKEYFIRLINLEKNLRRAKLRDLILKEPLVNVPGKIQLYSDLGFIILAWIVEIVSGEKIDSFVNEEIYKFIGVNDLFFIDNFNSDPGVPDNIYPRIVPTEQCPWREKLLKAEVHDDNAWAVGGIEGHAGLFGDIFSVWQVLMEIMSALTGSKTKVLNNSLMLKFMAKEKTSEFRAGFDTPSKYGSSSGKYFSDRSVGHLGFTGTSFWMDLKKSIIIIMLTNRVHPDRKNNKIKFFRPEIHNLIMEQFL